MGIGGSRGLVGNGSVFLALGQNYREVGSFLISGAYTEIGGRGEAENIFKNVIVMLR